MFLGPAIAAAIAITASAATTPENAALNDVYQRLKTARAAHDVAGMSAEFGPDGLLIDQRPGPVIAGRELAERMQPMAARLRTENSRIDTSYRIERRSMIGDIALDAGYMRQTVSRADGQQMTRYARFLVTMQRQPGGAWRIIGDASMTAQEPAWQALAPVEGLHYDA